jgi:hypothetical protein
MKGIQRASSGNQRATVKTCMSLERPRSAEYDESVTRDQIQGGLIL